MRKYNEFNRRVLREESGQIVFQIIVAIPSIDDDSKRFTSGSTDLNYGGVALSRIKKRNFNRA